MLPTLLVWQAQLQAAQRYAREQRLRLEQEWLAQQQHRRRWQTAPLQPPRRFHERVPEEAALAGPARRELQPLQHQRSRQRSRRWEEQEEEDGWEAEELRQQALLLATADQELANSQYTFVCDPALAAAAVLRWPVVLSLAAMLAYVGALAWQSHAAGMSRCS